MYKYSVPVDNLTFLNSDRESAADTFVKMGVIRVILGIGAYYFDHGKRQVCLDAITDNCKFLKSKGFEVAAWTWTFMDVRKDTEFMRMRLPSGKESMQSLCPSDPSFRKFAANYVCDLAGCGVDLILFDDDFRYGNLESSAGCVCENHLAYMSELLGEEVTLEALEDKLFCGGANKYRSAWITSKRYYFELFSKEMREALDKVAPHVRLGLCSSYCSWDQDSITPFETARILAGNTRPFVRLSGAPFWAGRLANNRLQDTIEFARLQLSFKDGNDDIEIVGEGDSYPRPRWTCAASRLEGFDQALRVDGGASGLQKYTMDYTSSLRYETGYNDRHIKNLPVYEKIDSMFGDKESIGVRVFEHRSKYESSEFPTTPTDVQKLQHQAFSYASRMLAAAAIPTVFGKTDTVTAVFGENARYVPREILKNGVILDVKAAEILTERGIDVGIEKISDRVRIVVENFVFEDEKTQSDSTPVPELTLKPGARTESTFTEYDATGKTATFPIHNMAYDNDTKEIVGSYTYENADGERFLVFAFEAGFAPDTLLRTYARADQLKRIIPYLGKYCGFTVCTSPDLYTLAKRKDNTVAVGLWNFSDDSVEEPFILLDKDINAKIVSTIGCDAEICDGRIKLSRIEPFGFAAVEYSQC